MIKDFNVKVFHSFAGIKRSSFLSSWVLFSIFLGMIMFLLNLLYVRDIISSQIIIRHKIHTVFAIFSHTVMLMILLSCLIYLISRKVPNIVRLILLVFTFAAFAAVTLGDTVVLRIFGFHINTFIVSQIMQPEFLKSAGIPVSTVLTCVAQIIAFFIILLLCGFIFFLKNTREITVNRRKFAKRILLIICSVIVAEKAFLMVNNIKRPPYKYQLSKNIPIFYCESPIPLYRLFKGKIVDEKHQFKVILDGKMDTEYPVAEEKPLIKNKYNVLVIILESIRHDFFTREYFPNVFHHIESHGFLKDKNYSGSNGTHLGIFSIIYSISPYYAEGIKIKKIPSWIIEGFRSNGYDTAFYISSVLVWQGMDSVLNSSFDKVQSFSETSKESWERDRNTIDAVLKDIKSEKKPFLFSVFLDATHNTYSFPDSFVRFKPFWRGKLNYDDYLFIEKHREKIMNSYRNALLYSDSIIDRTIDFIQSSNLAENTIIIITSDHGEAFGEEGKFFHGTSMNNVQTSVPLAFILPRKMKKLSCPDVPSSNMDIFPTALDLMGAYSAKRNVMGMSLFQRDSHSLLSVAEVYTFTPYVYSVISNDRKVYFNFQNFNPLSDVTDLNDNRITSENVDKQFYYYILNQMNAFKKKAESHVGKL